MMQLILHGLSLADAQDKLKGEIKMAKRRLPPRVKSGKNKGQFKKRKGGKRKKRGRRRVGRPRKKKRKKKGNPNNCR